MKLSEAGKRLLVGRKLSSAELGQTLLPKRVALPVFASDALSSVAYAPDEILITLSLAGLAGLAFDWPIAILVAVVMLVVIASYRQNVHAYPSGGGDYEVATTNLGPNAGLTVASALLVDYVLTVAVSVSAGVQNATAIFPFLDGHQAGVAALVVLVLMALNLRGVRESGTLFAVPVYCFMLAMSSMVVVGLVRILVLGEELRVDSAQYEIRAAPGMEDLTGLALVALLARSFSSGSAALTGVEAISNGVPSFRRPKSRNAATTLALLGAISITMMLGVIWLANLTDLRLVDVGRSQYTLDGQVVQVSERTAIGQLAETVFDGFPPGFWFVVAATMLILFLAANTAFNGFPVLGSILARDGYLPRQLHTRGDRLAFSNGIVLLAAGALVLVLAFDAQVTALIQLYVIGVFVSFTVSQFAMTRHWGRLLQSETAPAARARMKRSRLVNRVGFALTALVLVVVVVSKLTQGAWIAILAMAAVFVVMKAVRRHYETVAEELALAPGERGELPSRVHAVVLVSQLHRATLRAVHFAKASQPSTLVAVTVAVEPERTEQLVADWDALDLGVALTVVASPYREVTTPVLQHVKALRTDSPRDVVQVYVPEYVVGHWWETLLHNQSALRLKALLLFSPGVMVTSVPYQLASSDRARARAHRRRPVRRHTGPLR